MRDRLKERNIQNGGRPPSRRTASWERSIMHEAPTGVNAVDSTALSVVRQVSALRCLGEKLGGSAVMP